MEDSPSVPQEPMTEEQKIQILVHLSQQVAEMTSVTTANFDVVKQALQSYRSVLGDLLARVDNLEKFSGIRK